MAVGTVTLSVIGLFRDSTIVAGVNGVNVGSASSLSSNLIYVPMGFGQILVLRETRSDT